MFFVKLNCLEVNLNNFSQFNIQEQEEIIKGVKGFIKEVQEKLKTKSEPISSTFKLDNSDKSGYQLFTSNKGERFKVYVAKDHPFIKGKKLDSSENALFSIEFKKGSASRKEGDETWCFEKDNSNFELKPLGDWPDEVNKKELEISYIDIKETSPIHFRSDNYVFSYSLKGKEKWVHINEKHPQIKELLSQDKLKKDNKFIIHYLSEDWKTDKALFFKEDNKELEIREV